MRAKVVLVTILISCFSFLSYSYAYFNKEEFLLRKPLLFDTSAENSAEVSRESETRAHKSFLCDKTSPIYFLIQGLGLNPDNVELIEEGDDFTTSTFNIENIKYWLSLYHDIKMIQLEGFVIAYRRTPIIVTLIYRDENSIIGSLNYDIRNFLTDFNKESGLYINKDKIRDLIGKYKLRNLAGNIGVSVDNIFENAEWKYLDIFAKSIPHFLSVYTSKSECGRILLFTAINWIKKTDRVLDMGCGSGVIGGYLAKELGVQVDAVDINSMAVSNANALKAIIGVQDKLTVWQSDGFNNVPPDKKYDVIIFNSPVIYMFPRENDNINIHDFQGRLMNHVLSNFDKFLAENGRMYVMGIDTEGLREIFKKYNEELEILVFIDDDIKIDINEFYSTNPSLTLSMCIYEILPGPKRIEKNFPIGRSTKVDL